jgi:hypothetical protein
MLLGTGADFLRSFSDMMEDGASSESESESIRNDLRRLPALETDPSDLPPAGLIDRFDGL